MSLLLDIIIVTTPKKKGLSQMLGKDRKEQAKLDALEFFSDDNKAGLISMFDMQNELVMAKKKLLNT